MYEREEKNEVHLLKFAVLCKVGTQKDRHQIKFSPWACFCAVIWLKLITRVYYTFSEQPWGTSHCRPPRRIGSWYFHERLWFETVLFLQIETRHGREMCQRETRQFSNPETSRCCQTWPSPSSSLNEWEKMIVNLISQRLCVVLETLSSFSFNGLLLIFWLFFLFLITLQGEEETHTISIKNWCFVWTMAVVGPPDYQTKCVEINCTSEGRTVGQTSNYPRVH